MKLHWRPRVEFCNPRQKEDQVCGQKLAEMAKKHSSEAFYALDAPLETAVFSVLVEMVKELDEIKRTKGRLNDSFRK